MKDFTKAMAGGLLLGAVIPWVALNWAAAASPQPPGTTPETTSVAGTTAMDGELLPVMLADGTWTEMDLEAYLVGVVLGEMPADFAEEALKAQAVVARTYALRRVTQGTKHPGGGVCTDYACCQAYTDPGQWEDAAQVETIRAAVAATAGQVLVYEGALIDATYFSCSGGRTEDALAVWGADVPYLQATDSPGEEEAVHFTDTVTFTAREFAACLGKDLAGMPAQWFGTVTYTQGGGVEKLEICGEAYTGTELRERLGLRSTAFRLTVVGDHITVTTRGYGHRVGMSQYGADAMARKGSLYTQILTHYYQGTQIVDKSTVLG